MDSLKIGPLEIILLLLLAVGLGIGMIAGPSKELMGGLVICVLLVVAFVSTKLSLYILVLSMLLGPEFLIGGSEGGGTQAGRGVTLRFDDILLIVIGLAWLVKAALRKDEAPVKWTPLNKPIMVYVAVFAFATLLGVFAGRVKPMTGFFFCLKYFEYFFVYFMVVNTNLDKQNVKALVTTALVTCFLVSLFALTYMASGERASAPFEGKEGEPNTLGGYLVLILSLVIGLLATPGSVVKKWPYWTVIVFGVLGLMATLSRASFLAAFVVMAVLMMKVSYRQPLVFLMTLVLIASVPFWAPQSVKERVFYTFTQRSEAGQIHVGRLKVDTSTSERLRSWQWAFANWQKAPLFGLGVTGGPFMDAQYPRVLAESGLAGVAAFGMLLWALFRVGFVEYHEATDPFMQGIALGFLLGLVGMLVHAIGSNTFIIVRIMEPFWLIAAFLVRGFLIRQRGEVPESEPALAGTETPGLARSA